MQVSYKAKLFKSSGFIDVWGACRFGHCAPYAAPLPAPRPETRACGQDPCPCSTIVTRGLCLCPLPVRPSDGLRPRRTKGHPAARPRINTVEDTRSMHAAEPLPGRRTCDSSAAAAACMKIKHSDSCNRTPEGNDNLQNQDQPRCC